MTCLNHNILTNKWQITPSFNLYRFDFDMHADNLYTCVSRNNCNWKILFYRFKSVFI